MCEQNSLHISLLRWLRSLVPVWYVAPLEMNEATRWGQGYNRSIRLQCRRRPNKATFNLLPPGNTPGSLETLTSWNPLGHSRPLTGLLYHFTHCTGGWLGPSAGVDRCGKSLPPPGFDPPNRSARSQALYRLSYREHFIFVVFHIVHSVICNSVITIRTNKCTWFFYRYKTTKHQILRVAGPTCPKSRNIQFV
jgi:hypothetical protein